MTTSRSGAGGKIVTNRRNQRRSVTPYDRPQPPPQSPPPVIKSPNWFTSLIVPPARALASGAGKILSSILTDSESSSSDSEYDVDIHNEHEIPYDGVNALDERKKDPLSELEYPVLNERMESSSAMKNITSSEMTSHGQDSQLSVPRTETKQIIEQLIMQETFTREERDVLVSVLHSRVVDCSADAGTEDVDMYDKAVLEAKKWFQDKKVGSSSLADLAHGTYYLNSTQPQHVESEAGSPADVARSYMKERPPWASPTKDIELRTPLTSSVKVFTEGTSNSVGHEYLSSSKKRSSLASGSWNIQEELRRVRAKATEDMLRVPSVKIDPSWFSIATTRQESAGVGNLGEGTIESESVRKTKPIDALVDAGVSSDPALAALELGQDGKSSEAPPSNPATSVSGHNEESGAVPLDGEGAALKFPQPVTPKLAEDQYTDPNLCKINGSPTAEVIEGGGRESVNGLTSSHASLSAGANIGENNPQNDVENHIADSVSEEAAANTTEGNCVLLSEVYLEVPIATETDSIASGSQNSLGLENKELSLDTAQPQLDIVPEKQRGTKPGKKSRRGRGRGK